MSTFFKRPSGPPGPRGPRGPRPSRYQKRENEHNINEDITAPKVRLVGEDIEVDVYPLEVARKIAKDRELDLVEIVPNADPPVCRIVDYQKFLYEKKKKEKEVKAKTAKSVMKEIRFG
ncbi:MAG: translation initiation factor IF-3, partial [Bacteroidota bacterium]